LAPAPEPILETTDLGYSYRPGRFAFRHLNLTLHRGEILGLLGRNGAGKTTCVRVLTTLLPPTEGKARVLGYDLTRGGRALRARMGVVLQAESLDYVTVERNLTLYALLWGVDRETARTRAEEMLTLFELEDSRKRKPWALSGGQRRRFQVARELMHDMDLLFLDEPTAGLDAVARQRILGYLRKRAQQGLGIIFTTHILHEADLLCDRIAVMELGRVLTEGTPEELKQRHGGSRQVTVEFVEPLGGDAQALAELLRRVGDSLTILEETPDQVSFTAKNPEAMVAQISMWAQGRHRSLARLSVREVTLEEAFLGMVQQRPAGEVGP
jgi:ABC-2 type transport system ATP-binding protein